MSAAADALLRAESGPRKQRDEARLLRDQLWAGLGYPSQLCPRGTADTLARRDTCPEPGLPTTAGGQLHAVKMVVVGDGGIGKTSLLHTATSGSFPENYITCSTPPGTGACGSAAAGASGPSCAASGAPPWSSLILERAAARRARGTGEHAVRRAWRARRARRWTRGAAADEGRGGGGGRAARAYPVRGPSTGHDVLAAVGGLLLLFFESEPRGSICERRQSDLVRLVCRIDPPSVPGLAGL